MSKRTLEERTALVKQWQESGKNMTTWCRENLIPSASFSYWIHPNKKKCRRSSVSRSNFVELQEDVPLSGIAIEYDGFKISLQKHFDATTLKQCLQILRK